MTPQYQWTYKQSWLAWAHQVPFHSDLLKPALRWLRLHVPLHLWHIEEWTGVYEHTVLFEYLVDQQQFRRYFSD